MKTFEKTTAQRVKAFQWLGGFTHPDIVPVLRKTPGIIKPIIQHYIPSSEADYDIQIALKKATKTDYGYYETDYNVSHINKSDWLLFDENDNFIKSMSDEEFKKQYREVDRNDRISFQEHLERCSKIAKGFPEYKRILPGANKESEVEG